MTTSPCDVRFLRMFRLVAPMQSYAGPYRDHFYDYAFSKVGQWTFNENWKEIEAIPTYTTQDEVRAAATKARCLSQNRLNRWRSRNQDTCVAVPA